MAPNLSPRVPGLSTFNNKNNKKSLTDSKPAWRFKRDKHEFGYQHFKSWVLLREALLEKGLTQDELAKKVTPDYRETQISDDDQKEKLH